MTHSSHPLSPVAIIQRLFDEKGHLQYGEDVTQLQHALQCGFLAEADGASPTLILAAVLHDIGHMLHGDAAQALADDVDDAHELIGAKVLERWFGPAVSEPVRLHVQAKRYLCARNPSYLERLSPLSLHTLSLQGGPMSPPQAHEFETQPFYRDAVALRQWDDAAKIADQATPALPHFLSKWKTRN